jgi:hypothetical protein
MVLVVECLPSMLEAWNCKTKNKNKQNNKPKQKTDM